MQIERNKFYPMTSEERIILTEEVYTFLIPYMNEIHGVNFSDRFWRILLAPYVTTVNTRRKLFWETKIEAKPGIEPINSHSVPSFKQKMTVAMKYYAKAYKSRGRRDEINNVLSRFDEISFGFNDPESVRADFPNYIESCFPIATSPMKGKRNLVDKLAEKQQLLFNQNVIRQLPKSCIEYFDYYQSLIPLYSPEKKVFKLSSLETTYTRYLLAIYSENGAKIHYFQHGAFYGEYKYYSPYEWEYKIADKYFTWGWAINEKDTPWKAYRLNRFDRNYQKAEKNQLYDCMIVFPQINSQNLPVFQKNTSLLIQNMDRTNFKRILVRPRPSAIDLKYDEQFNFINDDRVVIDNGKSNIGHLIAQSGLVIQYNYPSTNLLECLYVDHPSIVILTNNDPTDVVKPYYEFFLQNGVFHNDFESLSKHLKNLNVKQWWHDIVDHPMYQSYKHNFLRKE